MTATPLTPAPQRLSFGTKALYGFGSITFGVTTLSLTSGVLQPYLNRVIGLPALWVGTAIMATLLLDAFIDPLIGQFSDKLRTPWGRRHPLMYLSAPLVALFCVVFWNSPTDWPPEKSGVFLIGILMLLRLSVSLYEVPSAALAPELTTDYHQRTTLFGYRFFFLVVGGLGMNVVLYQVFLSPAAGGILNRTGYAHYGILAAAVMSISILISALGTHGRIRHLVRPAARQVPLGQVLREMALTLSNPSLMVVMASGVCSGVAGGLTSALSQYFYIELWGLNARSISFLAIAGVLASFSGVALAGPASRIFGKKAAMMLLFTVSVAADALPQGFRLLGLMPPNGSPWVLRILAGDVFFSGTLAITGFIIISSMIADVVEDAAVKTGVRSEGLLFAANGLLPKVTTGLGVFLAGIVITVVQFPTHAAAGAVSPEIMRHMSLLYLPFSTGMKALSIIVLIFYRIDKQAHEQNLATLADAAGRADFEGSALGGPAAGAAAGIGLDAAAPRV
jgi:GPH family glycoside/pentoside/hexuronide:cation symporter